MGKPSKRNQQSRRAGSLGGIARATENAENRAEKLAPGAGQVCFHALPPLPNMAEDGAYATVQKMLAAQDCFPTSPMELFENARSTLTLLAADAPAEEKAEQGPAKRGRKTVQ